MKWLFGPLGLRNLRSVWITMLISNLILLLIPVAMGAFLYTKVEESLQKGANRSNRVMLEQLKLSLDSKLNEVDTLAQKIMFDPKLEYLLKLKEDQDGSDRYKYIEFMKESLSRPGTNTNFILDYYVYFRNSDTILKSGLLTDSRKFYDMYYSYEGVSFEQWHDDLLLSFHTMAYLPSKTLLRQAEYDPMQSIEMTPLNVITFTQSLPGRDRRDITGSLVILIDEGQMKEMFSEIEYASDSSIYIVDDKGRTIMATNQEPLPSELLSNINGTGGLLHNTLNGNEQVVSYTPSEKEGWRYVLVTPRSVYMEQITWIKKWTFTLLILCLIIGLIAAFTIAYRNYSPLRKTVNTILGGKDGNRNLAGNEYEFIVRAIQGSQHEEKNLRGLLAQQTPVIRSNFLLRLIRGQIEVDISQTAQSLRFMDINFVSDFFSVMIVQIDDISRFNQECNEEQWALARFIISNIGRDMIQDPHQTYTVELDRDRVALVNNYTFGLSEHGEQEIIAMAESLKRMIEERFKIDITLAVGLPHKGAKSISESYAEAVAALEYRVIKGGGKIIYFQDITKVHSHYYYPIDIEVQLINFVRSGDTENALNLLDTIYRMNFESGSISPELGRCLFFNISSTFLKIINANGLELKDILGEEMDLFKDIFSYGTAESMHVRCKEMYFLLTKSFDPGRTHIQLLDDISRFVEEHISDSNMSLNMIADQFDMTPQYISSFYKKHSGMNLSDYILRKRIKLAKEHMTNKDMTNAQIAQLVGYTSDVVFIRAFKKIEGVTPGRYRDNMLDGAQAPEGETLISSDK